MFEKNDSAIETLKSLAKSGIQSIVISGPSGSGKTYCASLFRRFVKTDDFILVDPKMQDIRDMLCGAGESTTVCIENIDSGVVGVSQAVLKFIETPPKGIYVIITCRRVDMIPETILSRCAHVVLPPITPMDLIEYVKTKYPAAADAVIKKTDVWSAVSNTHDIDWLCGLNERSLSDLSGLYATATSGGAISSIVWKLQHFSDGTNLNTEFVMRYLMRNGKTPMIRNAFRKALDDITFHIPAHAALSKAIMSVKYEVAL